MSSKKADISQIRKYLNGELNAKAMHQLEHEALDDPFLMDALEGYEANGNDQQHNLDELAERLRHRTTEKKGRVIPWRLWSIAASILVVLTIGGLWLRKTPPAERERVADVIPPPDETAVESLKQDTIKAQGLIEQTPLIAQNAKPAAPVLKKAYKPTDNAIYQQEISAADSNVPAGASSLAAISEPPPVTALKEELKRQEDTNKDKTQRLSEAVVIGYTSQSSFTPPKKDTAYSDVLFNKKTRVAASPSTILLGKVPGLTVIPADRKSQAEAQRITGIILSKDDGSPVIGAAIRVKGTNRSTVTNTYGHFSLPVVFGNSQTLDIASIGYERKQVNVKGGDSLKVELNQVSGSLNEVIVVGSGKKDPDDEPAAESAHPQNGWSSLKKYLQANAFLPDGTTGSVSVTFMVATDGTLSDLKIKKSLNTVADQKAIDLIKAGPSWIGNNNHKPEQVTVKVKFQKQQ